MMHQWNIWQPDERQLQAITALSEQLDISLPAARMLVHHNILTAEQARTYIRPSLDELHDPFLMKDMDKAVARLDMAIRNHERIMVYGDYDVDGTTATALMYTFLQTLTDNLTYYIPERETEGYGISYQGVDTAQQDGCTLIIALDCGIKEHDKARYAAQRGISMIICDHHTPDDTIPQCDAVLNMKRADCPYPFKDLSGCGVGFKLVQAYAMTHQIDKERWIALLPYLAMSIVSDVVSMVDENRILTHFGLKQINSAPPVGIQAIIEVAKLQSKQISVHDLLFQFGPRINSSGRMRSGKEAVQLLIATDLQQARQLANNINDYNGERRQYEQQATQQALEMLAADPMNDSRHSTVIYSPGWHKGVVGIVASRLTENYYRPTIVLTSEDGETVSGSARSVSDFDIYSAIDSCRDLLTAFGGHLFAAGLSMPYNRLEEFKRRFEEYVAAHISPRQTVPVIDVEQEIELSDITNRFYQILRCIEPFGPGNPQPLFVTRNVINNRYTKRCGENGEHLHLDLTDRQVAISGIAFRQGDKALHIQNGNPVDVCYELNQETFRNVTSIKMMVKDIHL
ncbi:MAG: single-stranded-DNA-specific exonuclease RecJ [Paludibacteraceae bacterium]|nr:single-stranded-DNA-specific exonuclease RecJ [Paludibacteraceae bacterium]